MTTTGRYTKTTQGGDSEVRPALLVAFISHPGLQKTEICEELHELQSDDYQVQHFNTNHLQAHVKGGRAYWQQAAALACAPSSTGLPAVVLAHKNLVNTPAGNWERVSGYLAESRDSPFETMAVFLTDDCSASTPELANTVTSGRRQCKAPFSMNQLSLAMLRVLKEKEHEGQLDGESPEALRVLCGFASSYRNMSAASVQEQLQGLFDHGVMLPVTRAQSGQPCNQPGKAEKLRALCAQGFLDASMSHSKGPSDEWEEELRSLLQDPHITEFVEALAVPLDEQVATLAAYIKQRHEAVPAEQFPEFSFDVSE